MFGFYILEVFGPKRCIKSPECILKNLIGGSPASVLSMQVHSQILVSVLKVFLHAHCIYMLVLLLKLSLPKMSFTKVYFGLEGRLCSRASINFFVNQNQHCLVMICA